MLCITKLMQVHLSLSTIKTWFPCCSTLLVTINWWKYDFFGENLIIFIMPPLYLVFGSSPIRCIFSVIPNIVLLVKFNIEVLKNMLNIVPQKWQKIWKFEEAFKRNHTTLCAKSEVPHAKNENLYASTVSWS